MGAQNKLLLKIGAEPFVRHVVATLNGADVDEVIVVTGHDAKSVATAVAGLGPRLTHNVDYRSGMGSSLANGIAAVSQGVDAALICLGDMPRVRPDTIKRIVAAFAPWEQKEICVPVKNSRRGHPVLFGRRFFPDLRALTGDVGARGLIDAFPARVAEVAVDDGGIFADYDTPEDFR